MEAPSLAIAVGTDPLAIHILEDDPGVSDSLRSLLMALGYSVHLYVDGESFFEAPPPEGDDIVIVDLGLPGIGGAQVLRWLSNLRDLPKVIVISGQSQRYIEEALANTGIEMPFVLRKPLTGEALTSIL